MSFSFDLVGMTARSNDSGGLDLLSAGATVGKVPPMTVATRRRDVPLPVAGAAMTVETDGAGRKHSRITLSVSREWLSGLPPAAFPVVIDPTVQATVGASEARSFSKWGGFQNGVLKAGIDDAGQTWRGAAFLPTPSQAPPGANPPWRLERAFLRLVPRPGTPSPIGFSKAYGLGGAPTSFDSVADGQQFLATEGSAITFDVSSWMATRGASWFGFVGGEVPNEDGPPTLGSFIGPDWNGVSVDYYYRQAPPPTTVTSPVNGSTISTTTPTLTARASSPPEPNTYYDFKVGTRPDGGGMILDSGWVGSGQWTVPLGALVDGMTYYATVLVDIGLPERPDYVMRPAAPGGVTKFVVKQRLGAGGPSPTDTVGATPQGTTTPSEGSPSPGTPPASMTVNMVTGNLALTVGTRSLQTVGGTAGVTLGYDSKGSDGLKAGQRGLFGQYYSDDGTHGFAPQRLLGRRLDPSVDVSWSGGAPMGGFRAGSAVLAKWTGTVAFPAGTWQIGGLTNGGGMRIYIDGGLVYDRWSGGSMAAAAFSSRTWPAGQPRQIEVHYWSDGRSATAQLWARNLNAPLGQPRDVVVPTGWLAPRAAGLPSGWRIEGASGGSWTRLHDEGIQVVLESSSGETVAFTARSDGSYQSAPGNPDLLRVIRDGPVSTAGRYQLATADNRLYVFGSDGTLQSVTTTVDDRYPAALQYEYANSPPVLSAIIDPVSNRRITLTYSGAGVCPAGSAAPPGMLCRIAFWDGTESTLTYNTNGQLARVTSPGNTVASFAYDTSGRLAAVRDALANDAVAAGARSDCPASATATPSCSTEISYDSAGRVTTVTQPAPTPGAPRPGRSYTYVTSLRSTFLYISGFNPTGGWASKVTYDDKSRITARRDSTGLTATTRWDDLDRPVATIDPTGLQTTTVYTTAGLVTDTWGPAPTSCFDPVTNLPRACSVPVPRNQTGYDENITGLAASTWANPWQAGPPVIHGTGPGGDGPAAADNGVPCPADTLCTQWNTLPDQLAGATAGGGSCEAYGSQGVCPFQWSQRLTGSITIPPGASSLLGLHGTQIATLRIDGRIVARQSSEGCEENCSFGAWSYQWSSQAITPGKHSIEIDYYGSSTRNGLALWVQRGAQLFYVPNSWFNPDFGLKTSAVDADGKKVATAYSNGAIGAEHGLATATTTDPGGLALTTTTTYEPPGPGTFLRRTAKALPSGATTTYGLYCGQPTGPGCPPGQVPGALATACGVAQNAPQGGLVAQQTDPDPDGAGGERSRTQQFLYDAAGRQVGRRTGTTATIAGEPWQCTTYDTRGRVTTRVSLRAVGAPPDIVTNTYAVGGNPLVASVSSTQGGGTITASVDLLGRGATYTTNGQMTVTFYAQSGEAREVTGPLGVQQLTYEANSGRLDTVSLDGVTLANADYDLATGRASKVAYSNGTTMYAAYEAFGRPSEVNYYRTGTGNRITGDAVMRSPAGRIVDQLIDTLGSDLEDRNPAGPNFVYDGAGRLTTSVTALGQETISYAANPACGLAPNAGRNTNRTAVTRNGTTDSYCYDQADRLRNGPGIPTATYDTHGNTLTLGPARLAWDSTDRNTATTQAGTTTTYTRDAVDRVTTRTLTGAVNETTGYRYNGHGASPDYTVNPATGATTARMISLPGGVQLTLPAAGAAGDTWAYPNLHGDITQVTDRTGTPTVLPAGYTAWGAGTPPVTIPGTAQPGTLGTNGILTEPATNPLPITQMGARPYVASLGRFLSIDPIEGGCANDYAYVHGDPVNTSDPTGQFSFGCLLHRAAQVAGLATIATCFVGNLVACGIAAGISLGFRAADRGVNSGWRRSLGDNLADGTISAATFGLLTSLGFSTKEVLASYPLWQQLISKGIMGSVGGASFLGGQLASQQSPKKKKC